MTTSNTRSLGRLVAVHPISPAYLQRAVILAALSFIFFLAMMFAVYVLKDAIYFLLASAFLVIYLVMMYSFFAGRKKAVEVYENGVRIGRDSATWDRIGSVDDDGTVVLKAGDKLSIAQSIHERDRLLRHIRTSIE